MQHFTIQELSASATAERLAIDNTPPRAAQRMLTILVEQLLDPIRRRYGAPIIVTSGYRCPALNTAVGGVTNSHHIVGCAADIKGTEPPSNLPLRATLVTPPSLCDTPSINRGGVRALQASLQNISGEHPEGAPHRGGRREGASVATATRYDSVACDEGRFISPEERALAPLDLSLQRSLACEHQRTEGVCRGGAFNLALFHLIVQMQREGAIRFTQLIAEKDYRWLHISYVPGMLRNQVIDVNINVLGRAKCFAIDVNDNVNQPSARQLTSSLKKDEAKESTLLNDTS